MVSPAWHGRVEPRRWRRRVLVACAAVLGVVLLAGVWVGWRASQAARALSEARSTAARMHTDLRHGSAPAPDDVAGAAAAASRAHAATRDPVYRLASGLPWVGDQLGAVASVAAGLDEVTSVAVPPLVDLVTAVDDGTLRTDDGTIDLGFLAAAAPQVRAADQTITTVRADIGAISRSGLIGPLATAVRQADDALASLATTVHQARQVTDLAPAMLGADGPRTYLVLALNNAELRPAGGIVGAGIALSIDGGHVTLGTQLAASALATGQVPVLPLTDDELAADGDRLGRYLQNATLTADFPRTAELARARWHQETGEDVDGVVALDAVAVATVLRAVGPVTTDDGTVFAADTFVAAILRDPYLGDVDPVALDETFAQVAASVFTGLLTADLDGAQLMDTVRDVVAGQRLRVWSAHEAEQAVLAATTLGGAFGSAAAADAGVFLTDTTGGKLNYYLTVVTSLSTPVCTGGTGTAQVEVTFTYEPPADIADASVFLRGVDEPGRARGDAGLLVTVYPTAGGVIGPVTVDGAPAGGQQVVLGARTGVRVPVTLAPGQTTTLVAQVPVGDGRAAVWTTPTVSSGGIVVARCP
ncbi:MAG: DUF4012 domain-containing protein [Micrococcales bacterium]|nr:DUF4012 domain-containing protein [Micrococcales bacterium]